MKLSQKLLGLAGLAMADYACCPYDDYGMPHAACAALLTEKTPFVGGAQQSFVGNDCKAWETNIDAQYEGNNRNSGCAMYNWGSCGFQRHFPWKSWDSTERELLSLGAAGTDEVTIDVDVSGGTTPNTAAFDATTIVSTSETLYNVGASPFLGGMCKLFVPVPATQIVQVQVAGVHKPAGLAQFPGRVRVANENSLPGTVYCFGVANIAESMDNTNNVHNGNVAGDGLAGNSPNGRSDPFFGLTSLNRQAGVAYTLQYGTPNFADQNGSQTNDAAEQIVAYGANFDVVAHFSDSFCEGTANVVEMQLAGDENDDDTDYEYNQNAADFTHAHNDVLDKRHTTAGYGGYWIASTLTSGYLASEGNAASEAYKWPNAGAWAAYYSTVVCAKSSATFNPATDPQKSLWTTDREYILSVSANDYRRNDDGQNSANCATDATTHRFNLRQVGNNIQACGPGTLPDVGTARCTWNWTYSPGSYGTSNAGDPEGFFDRSDQMVVDTWNRKRRNALDRSTQLGGNSALVTSDVTMTVSFKTNDGTAITTTAATADGPQVTATAGATTAVVVSCTAGVVPAGGNQRDAFPDCFQGDEVHFEISYVPCSNPASCTSNNLINNWFSTVA